MEFREILKARTEHDVVLGRDSFRAVLARNAGKVLACDIWSRGFVWAAAASWAAWTGCGRTATLPETVQLALQAHALVAWLHWSARDQFKEVVSASAAALRAWKGAPPAGPEAPAATEPAT